MKHSPSHFCFSREFLVFDEGFFLEWGKSLVIGTNYFSDPGGNVLNIKFDENLVAERKFRGVSQILGFYNLQCMCYVCTLFCGDRYFRLRLFDSYWKEIEYPMVGQSRSAMTYDPFGSPRFFQCFRVKLLRSRVKCCMPYIF